MKTKLLVALFVLLLPTMALANAPSKKPAPKKHNWRVSRTVGKVIAAPIKQVGKHI